MVKGRVSVLIPANGEKYLQPTINDLIAHATGDIEIIAVLDGWWPVPSIETHPRVHLLHWGAVRGMRPGINAATRLATGEFFMKIDAHCSVTQGFDDVLKADYHERNWVVVPRRGSLYPNTWEPLHGAGQTKDGTPRNGKAAVDYHFLSYPFEKDRPGAGLHGQVWVERARAKMDVLVDDEMSSQGSCWFMHREHFEKRIVEMQVDGYGNFVSEFQELGCKTWLGGGKVMVNKKCEYLHWHKGKEGRGYFINKKTMAEGHDYAIKFWMTDQPFPGKVHNLKWLVEHFWPVPSWPTDLDAAFADARAQFS